MPPPPQSGLLTDFRWLQRVSLATSERAGIRATELDGSREREGK